MIRAFVISVPVFVAVTDCFGSIAKVDGISMQPALNPENDGPSDFVFLSRWSAKSFEYQRGDIVSFVSPKNPDQRLIKRIIGIEGDLVETLNYKQRHINVPRGHCWVEGDHTGHSLDSNFFGPLAIGLITAKASRILWPPARWGKIPSQVPDHRTPRNLLPSSLSEEDFDIEED